MDVAEIPASVAERETREVSVTRGKLEASGIESEGGVALTLLSRDLEPKDVPKIFERR